MVGRELELNLRHQGQLLEIREMAAAVSAAHFFYETSLQVTILAHLDADFADIAHLGSD